MDAQTKIVQYIWVLDYEAGKTFRFEVPASWESEEMESFLFGDENTDGRFRESAVEWMSSADCEVHTNDDD